jgi:formiminotetrahydrofolate cyclodeaminase
MTKLIAFPCEEFIHQLSSGAPVPGGGGAAARSGSVGAALAGMVGNLTVGKKKYAVHEPQVIELMKRAKSIEKRMLEMVDEDAELFLPLSEAYRLKADTPEAALEKKRRLESALKDACMAPMQILQSALEGIEIHDSLVDRCSTLAISDIGVGVQCLRSALAGAHLNILINLQLIEDQEFVAEMGKEAESALNTGMKLADHVYGRVIAAIAAPA